MELRVQHHASAALPATPRESTPVPILQEARWVPDSVLKKKNRKTVAPAGTGTPYPVVKKKRKNRCSCRDWNPVPCSLVAIPTAVSRKFRAPV